VPVSDPCARTGAGSSKSARTVNDFDVIRIVSALLPHASVRGRAQNTQVIGAVSKDLSVPRRPARRDPRSWTQPLPGAAGPQSGDGWARGVRTSGMVAGSQCSSALPSTYRHMSNHVDV